MSTPAAANAEPPGVVSVAIGRFEDGSMYSLCVKPRDASESGSTPVVARMITGGARHSGFSKGRSVWNHSLHHSRLPTHFTRLRDAEFDPNVMPPQDDREFLEYSIRMASHLAQW